MKKTVKKTSTKPVKTLSKAVAQTASKAKALPKGKAKPAGAKTAVVKTVAKKKTPVKAKPAPTKAAPAKSGKAKPAKAQTASKAAPKAQASLKGKTALKAKAPVKTKKPSKAAAPAKPKAAPKKKAEKKKAAPKDNGGFPEKLRDIALGILDDRKAENIVVADLKDRNPMADYAIVATGQSSRQVAALSDYLGKAFSLAGAKNIRIEGMPEANWVLVDAGDVIVHLFRPDVRAYYNIEEILSGEAGPRS